VSQDEPQRISLAEARAARAGRPEVAAAYEQARLRFELAEAVRARREGLGLSQRQLAERAGMTQPGIARFEAGGTTPTLPLLERLATALGLTLNVSLAPAERRSAQYVIVLGRRRGVACPVDTRRSSGPSSAGWDGSSWAFGEAQREACASKSHACCPRSRMASWPSAKLSIIGRCTRLVSAAEGPSGGVPGAEIR
jgi:HTH-type transcriptional regulator / antitoxin HipB